MTTETTPELAPTAAADTAAEVEEPTPYAANIAAGIAVWSAGPKTAWAVVTSDEHSLSGVVRGRDERAAYLAAFEEVLSITNEPEVTRVELFCGDASFLSSVTPLSMAWPVLTIHPWTELRASGWLVRNACKLAKITVDPAPEAESIASYEDTTPLLAATDGSKGAKGCSGFGWVTEEGEFGFGRLHGSILLTELAAVEALLAHTPARRPLAVLVDSQPAIRVLEGLKRGEAVTAQPVPGTHASWALLRRIQSALRGRAVSFRWVRGHAGNALNETADRIAVQARRHLNGGTAPDVLAGVMSRIIDDLRTTAAYRPSQPMLAQTA